MLIGLVGKAGSGKTMLASYLEKNYGFVSVAYGTILKEMLLKTNIVTPDEVYVKKTPKSRFFLQFVGTEIIRDQIDVDFFVKSMEKILDGIKADNAENVVVHDVRFRNEARLLKERGGIIVRIRRDNAVGNKDRHRSETDLDSFIADYIFDNNTTPKGLFKQVKKLFEGLEVPHSEG